jgi:hypothetical protein
LHDGIFSQNTATVNKKNAIRRIFFSCNLFCLMVQWKTHPTPTPMTDQPNQKKRSHDRASGKTAIAFSISQEEFEILKATAARLGRPRSWIVQQLVRIYALGIKLDQDGNIIPEGSTTVPASQPTPTSELPMAAEPQPDITPRQPGQPLPPEPPQSRLPNPNGTRYL